MSRAAMGLLLWGIVGCGAATDDELTSCQVDDYAKLSAPDVIDLLLVISDSPAMAPVQDDLIAFSGELAVVLETIEGGLPSLHLAVVGPDGFTGVALVDETDVSWRCPDDSDGRCGDASYTGELGDAIAGLIAVGGGGLADQPLFDRLIAALDSPAFADFSRPEAYLAIAFIATEDDASAVSPTDAATALATSRGEAGVLAMVVGPAPAPRLAAFASAFENRNASAPITSDWTDAFLLIPELFKETLDVPCVDGADLTDVDPDEPGRQLDCVATDEAGSIPRCEMASDGLPDPTTPRPCYWLRDWGDSCPAAAYVERASTGAPAQLQCQSDC